MSSDKTTRLIVEAAERWWISRRPLAWDEQRHLAHATVNCATKYDGDLAVEVAKWRAKLLRDSTATT